MLPIPDTEQDLLVLPPQQVVRNPQSSSEQPQIVGEDANQVGSGPAEIIADSPVANVAPNVQSDE